MVEFGSKTPRLQSKMAKFGLKSLMARFWSKMANVGSIIAKLGSKIVRLGLNYRPK